MARQEQMMMLRIGNNIRYSKQAFTPHLVKPRSLERNLGRGAGFTLIELMISAVILGFGLIIIIQSYLASLNGLKISQNYAQAMSWAAHKLTELQLSAYEKSGLLPKLESGTASLNSRQCSWVSEVKEISQPEYLTEELVEVCLELNWQERNIIKDAALATILPRKKEK